MGALLFAALIDGRGAFAQSGTLAGTAAASPSDEAPLPIALNQGQATPSTAPSSTSSSPLPLISPAAAATTDNSPSQIPPAPIANGGLVKTTDTGPAPIVVTPPPLVMPVKPSDRPDSAGISIPSPPPPSAFTNDPNQLAVQAQQAAQDAQAQADAEQMHKEQEHNVKSYDKASTGLLPLNPDQIRDFMRRLEQTQDAALPPSSGPPRGETRIATLSLDPGVDPPQVNLASGYVTTITIVDATGEPWPILDVGVGGNFEVSPTQAGTHVVRVMPLTRVGMGDLSVMLKDCPTPIIFRLSAGGPTVDLRYDARIGKLGPGAKPQIIARPRLEAGDETLTLILENAPPNSAKRLKVGGLDARTKAWSIGDKVYVRTPLTLLSPAWNASEASADGTMVYEIGDAPVLLMSDNGSMVRAQISRGDDHDK
jgi:intracellular multiplication protein IcmK